MFYIVVELSLMSLNIQLVFAQSELNNSENP